MRSRRYLLVRQRHSAPARPVTKSSAKRPNRRVWPSSLAAVGSTAAPPGRSEEHTSELQSLMRISYAVFCLKKKKQRSSNNKKEKNKRQTNRKKENTSKAT